jgi:hypothetical protein
MQQRRAVGALSRHAVGLSPRWSRPGERRQAMAWSAAGENCSMMVGQNAEVGR